MERRMFAVSIHRKGRPWDMRADEVDWAATAVGSPRLVEAKGDGRGRWWLPGPLWVETPEALTSQAAWALFEVENQQVPIATGPIGHDLVAGGRFQVPLSGWMVVLEP
jgi:hypothetical protein